MTDFREDGAAALEWAARYLERVGELPVLAQVKPGELSAQLPASAPEQGPAGADWLSDEASREAEADQVAVGDLLRGQQAAAAGLASAGPADGARAGGCEPSASAPTVTPRGCDSVARPPPRNAPSRDAAGASPLPDEYAPFAEKRSSFAGLPGFAPWPPTSPKGLPWPGAPAAGAAASASGVASGAREEP